MLRYTGHPLVDVGAATIAAFARRRDLEHVTSADLDAFADYIAQNYVVNPLKSFLNVAFPNSGYTQPAFESAPERRVSYARRVTVVAAKDDPTNEVCVFTGEPATGEWLSAKELDDKQKLIYPRGRAFRHNVPMLIGEDVINFHPGGDAGLPISGKALLCIQAFPMGCAKVGGKLLGVHSDNPMITLRFARKFLQANLAQVEVARGSGESKLPEAGSSPKTMLIETLLDIEDERIQAQEEQQPYSATAYHLSNSGQSNPLDARNPPLEMYEMPLEMIDFLGSVSSAAYASAWRAIRQRGWVLPKAKKKTKKTESVDGQAEAPPHRSLLYEDLFNLPQDAPRFIRRYLLRVPQRNTFDEDPRRRYSIRDEASLISWRITQLFLEKVVHMTEQRIQTIREMADRLADYIKTENDKPFFAKFYSATYYDQLRKILIRASDALMKRGQPPLVGYADYIAVFEEPEYDRDEKKLRTSWSLARDLMLIRMIERLYELKWLQANLDAIPDETAQDDDKEKQQDS
jgi:CRISPR-associated protein Cst1